MFLESIKFSTSIVNMILIFVFNIFSNFIIQKDYVGQRRTELLFQVIISVFAVRYIFSLLLFYSIFELTQTLNRLLDLSGDFMYKILVIHY